MFFFAARIAYVRSLQVISSYPSAFTRYTFTSRLLCTNQSSLYCPPPHLQCPHDCITLHDYCAIDDPLVTPLVYAIHHTYWQWQSRVRLEAKPLVNPEHFIFVYVCVCSPPCFPLAVESRIGLKGGFGFTPGKLVTLK